jgi:hypothetical protein
VNVKKLMPSGSAMCRSVTGRPVKSDHPCKRKSAYFAHREHRQVRRDRERQQRAVRQRRALQRRPNAKFTRMLATMSGRSDGFHQP